MKRVTILSQVNLDSCTGCKICQKVCPVYAIEVKDRKAIVEEQKCRGCANCADRCPFYAVTMVKREKPFEICVEVKPEQRQEVDSLCEKAHFHPEQVLCYCVGTRAEEVAAAIVNGTTTPHELSSLTGIRTGCTIECIQPILRLLDAAGHEPKPDPNGFQWYGKTVTAWDLPQEAREKYNSSGFFFEEDRVLLDRVCQARAGKEEK